ncbi:M23 family metallopeptidase [Schaalia sp. ZJ1691]|uniref:M23 family metallopeptidase n=1 Tax=Schaalia sp. ZJ1691 TaxID=2709404 RepID=UPI001F14CB9B|nr:M23 family metallopeptidase [Schaalia sp. ZJ1691]
MSSVDFSDAQEAARPRSWGRGIARAGVAATCTVALAFLASIPAMAEDDRDAAVREKDKAAASVSTLESQLEGIDSNLAQIYIELDSLKSQIPTAQAALDEAHSRFDAATREHEVALGQLESAQAEKDSLRREIKKAEDQQTQASQAIASLARQMYKDGSPSAIAVALTAEGTASIDDRAAAANAMSRSQSQALSAALGVEATHRSQVSRQEAITKRISSLEQTAKKAADDAEAAKNEAAKQVESLTTLKAQAEAKQKEWDSKKDTAKKQLDEAQAELKEKLAALEKIDAENRRKNYVTRASSTGWRYPLTSVVITSPFGWRIHPVLGYGMLHEGTDMAAACGTPIYPVAEGEVVAATSGIGKGNYVHVNHGLVRGSSIITEYMHLQRIYVSPGQHVTPETVLGEVGTTGYSTGCHLHLSVIQNGTYVDPMNFF